MKKIEFFKYHGTGNDFIMIDNRVQKIVIDSHEWVAGLCHRRFGIGADGLILIEESGLYDFRMKYFNADGREGSMCGNGGRCAVAFTSFLGIISESATFEAIDGIHEATILNKSGNECLVALKMNDVNQFEIDGTDFILNTGSPHFVRFMEDIQSLNVVEEGRKIRYSEPFAKDGINVNFISCNNGVFNLRTYERGVEDETWSCGTGSVAAAITLALANKVGDRGQVSLNTPGGPLRVSFHRRNDSFKEIILTGAAIQVFKGLTDRI
jgi:diaminopimelate epimerase